MELSSFLNPLRRWWWLILLSTVIAAGISFYVASIQPPLYRASATLIVGQPINDPNPTGPELATGQQLAVTYADIALREPVRRAVSEKLQLSSPPTYNVAALERTQLLEISVADTNPERAAAIANAVAEELIAISPSALSPEDQEQRTFISEQLASLQVRIGETEELLAAKQEELGSLFSAQQIQEAQAEITALEGKLNTLQMNYASLLAGAQENPLNSVNFVERATVPRAPVDPQIALTVLVAAAVGLSLAAGAAYLLEYLDRTVRTPEDVAQVTSIRTLVSIPRISEKTYESVLVTLKHPRSPISEAYRSLRTLIRSHIEGQKGFVLLVNSPNKSDGKSVTTANLVVSLAQVGVRVLLIDANLRRPSQHVVFDLENEDGLSQFAAPSHWSGSGITATAMERRFNSLLRHPLGNLDIITSGPLPANASELVGSSLMPMVLEQAKKQDYDLIVIDSPPCLYVPDALDISSHADAVLLVVRAGETSPGELRDALTILAEVGANVIGIALNSVNPTKGGYYYGRRYVQSEDKQKNPRPVRVADSHQEA